MKTYHYIVKGIVQGVFFRHNTKEAALKHNIKGTVKNLFNGDVEVYAQGPEEDIAEFEKFLNAGPRLSRVDQVIKKIVDSAEIFEDFKALY
jgi:acylphosphatase